LFGNSALVHCLYLSSLVRKPTATDTDSSCHSPQHQETALPYEQSKELQQEEKMKHNIQTIPYNNGYYHITIKINKEHKKKKKR
jgi:hypothetical protein